MRSFPLFLALRYLKPKRTFLSVITLISIVGVMLGIAVLILVISVMTGFDRELRRKVLGFEPHIVVMGDGVLRDWRPMEEKIKAIPGVLAVAPFVQGPVIAEYQDRIVTPLVRAIDPDAEQEIVDLKKLVHEGMGKFDLDGDSAVLGRDLAETMGVHVGDKITIYAPGNMRGILDEIKREGDDAAKSKTLADLKNDLVLPAELTVTGLFESGRYQYDSNVFFVSLHIGQELYSLEDAVHGLSVKTTNPYHAEEIKRALNHAFDEEADRLTLAREKAKEAALNGMPAGDDRRSAEDQIKPGEANPPGVAPKDDGQIMPSVQRLPPSAFAQTWIDRNKDLFDAIRMERSVMFFILMFIIIVAAFGIMNTLITVTVQKTREIGILKALGATVWQIVVVFLAQGMIVGFFGNLAGVALGMTLIGTRNAVRDWLASTLGIKIFPADIYQFSQIPAEVVPGQVAIICITAFVICSLAALIPAWFAARLDPVKALRYE